MKKIKKSVFVLSLVMFVNSFILAGQWVCSSAAANGIKGFEYISMIIDAMIGKENKGCSIVRERGELKVNGEKIEEKDYAGYVSDLGLKSGDAEKLCAAVKLGIITGSVKKYGKNITTAVALKLISNADRIANGTDVSEADISFCVKNRIADISKVKKQDRKGESEGYIRGFIKGTAKNYSHKRTLKGNKKISLNAAKDMVAKLYDLKARYTLSPDFQITRTKDLPRNAELYSYIVDSFPNAYYETGFNGMSNKNFFDKGVGLGADSLKERMQRTSFTFVFPFELDEFNSLEYPGPCFSYDNQTFTITYRNGIVPNEMVGSCEEFYRYALNVDYRTIEKDKKWQKVMRKYLTKKEIKDYIKHCKENKTIIECDVVAADRSSVYWYNGEYNCKIYAHMRVVSDIPTKLGKTMGSDQDTYGYLYPVKRGYEPGTLFTRSVLGPLYMDYKLGEWTDFYLNASGSADMYGCLCCSNTSRGIMIDYSGLYPWLIKFPFG